MREHTTRRRRHVHAEELAVAPPRIVARVRLPRRPFMRLQPAPPPPRVVAPLPSLPFCCYWCPRAFADLDTLAAHRDECPARLAECMGGVA